MSSGRAARAWGMTIVVAVGLSGCDRLPGYAKDQAETATAATPAAPLAPIVPEADRVATVNGTHLSATDVELAVQELKRFVELSQQPWEALAAEDKGPEQLDLVDVLNSVTETELKAQDAKSRGLDIKTDIMRRKAYLDRNFFAQEWDRVMRTQLTPTEQEVHQFYEDNKLGFTVPELIRVRQIVTATLPDAESVRAQAAQAGANFADLAAAHSIGAGKDTGGDAGWHVQEYQLQQLLLVAPDLASDVKVFFQQLAPVAFALQEPGQITQPVKGPDGFYLVQLTERKPGEQKSELETRDAIRAHLTEVALRKKLEELRKKASIQEFTDRLRGVQQ